MTAADDGLEIGRSPGRQELQDGQVSRVVVHDVASGEGRVVHVSDRLLESPNWTPDGTTLVVNGGGDLYRLPVAGGEAERIETDGVAHVNNDHVLTPDGATVVFSAAGHLYRVPIGGGSAVRISNEHPAEQEYSCWLHGISPDGTMLAYVAVEPWGGDARGRRNLATIPFAGGPDRLLTDGTVAFDGPEYSPDGRWLYYSSEEAATRPGHAQLFRVPLDGTEPARWSPEQLTADERVNWFPHLDPSGTRAVYISYEPGTISHPADVWVQLRLIGAEGGEPSTAVTCFGGQGTLNVTGWSPDGTAFAYVDYPARAYAHERGGAA
jgi:Tol biopolymer transport system component